MCAPNDFVRGVFMLDLSTMDTSTTAPVVPKRSNWARYRRMIFLPVSFILALLAWEVAVYLGGFPPFILPPPSLVWSRLVQVVLDGSLLRHALVTLSEVIVGLVLGVCVATSLGYALAKWPAVERLLSPYVVASQSVPISL